MPLILASLIKGISDLKDISKLSTIGTRTLGVYVCTTVLAVIVGLVLVNIVQPGNSIKEETRIDLVQEYEQGVLEKQQQAQRQAESGPLQPLVDVVPSNIFDATTNNRNMLQVIFFAIFFGIGMILVPPKQAKPVKDFFDGFNTVILKLIDLIMLSAPYGVFALLATLVVESPSIDLFIALGMYSLTLIIGLAIMIVVYMIIVKFVTNTNPMNFMNGVSAAQLLGFSTSSSGGALADLMARHPSFNRASFVVAVIVLTLPLVFLFRIAEPGSALFLTGMVASIALFTLPYGAMIAIILDQVPDGIKASTTALTMFTVNVLIIGSATYFLGLASDIFASIDVDEPMSSALLIMDTLLILSLIAYVRLHSKLQASS